MCCVHLACSLQLRRACLPAMEIKLNISSLLGISRDAAVFNEQASPEQLGLSLSARPSTTRSRRRWALNRHKFSGYVMFNAPAAMVALHPAPNRGLIKFI